MIVGIAVLMFSASMLALQVPVAKAATLEEMQAQMSALMSQIAALQSQMHAMEGSSTAVFPGRPPMGGGAQGSTTLQIGTPIITTEALRIRSAAGLSAAFIATQPARSQGTIVEGPVTVDGYRWFKVDYVTGADGWNVGSWLKSNTAPVSGDWAHPPKLGMDGRQGSSSELQAKIAYVRAKLASTTDPVQRQEIAAMLAKLLSQLQGSSTMNGAPKIMNPYEMWMKNRASSTLPLPPRPVRVPREGGQTLPSTGSGSSSTSGVVLGVSTDILTEISATLNAISTTLSHMQ